MNELSLVLDLIIKLVANAQAISSIAAQMNSEGRTKLTADEWKAIFSLDDEARRKLVDALAARAATPAPQA